MMSSAVLKRVSVMLCSMLLLSASWGQTYVTKSGSTVSPAPRLQASFPPASKNSPSDSPGLYAVVSPSDFAPFLTNFLQWKRMQGFQTHLFCPDHPNKDSIRNSLSHLYASSGNAPMYILLVGDVDHIPAWLGKNTPSGLNNHFTDMYYAEFTNDYIPEAFLGRLSVTDTNQLQQVLSKIIAYEQGLWCDDFHQVLLVAGAEDRSPAPITTNGQVNYAAQLVKEYHTATDTVCFRNPTSNLQKDSILQAITPGNTMVNYTAHCTSRGWSAPLVTSNDIDSFSVIPTVFINNCCLSNAFAGDCFGEKLLRSSSGGAVGVIGATNETLWSEDYYWSIGAQYPLTDIPPLDNPYPGALHKLVTPVDSATAQPPATLGQVLFEGCRTVTMAGSPFDAFYWEIYCLLGDPSMTPYWTHADTLSISLDDSIPAGNSILHLRCTPHARITATADTLLLGTTIVPANGDVELLLDHSINTDSITLTATRHEAPCAIKHLKVYHPAQPYLAVTHYHLDDTLLFLRIKNQGLTPARQHRISLTRYSDQGVILPSDPYLYIPFLPSLADTLVTFNLSNCYPGIEPLLSVIIMIQDSDGTYYNTLPVNIPMPDHRPVLTQLQILETDTTPCLQLMPNHTYLLSVTLAYPADSLNLSTTPDQSTSLTPCPQQFTIPFNTPDNPSHLQLTLTPHYGLWSHTYTYYITAYNTLEPFETADFKNMPWHHPNLYPWRIDSFQPHNGRYCARSAPIDHNQQSVLALDIDLLFDDTLSFFYNVSSEDKDWLNFYVDGRKRGYWSGNSGWQRHARLLTAGRHRLEWVYQKNASISQRDDCARIDDIRLPLALWQQPCGTPAPDSLLSIPPLPSNGTHGLFTISPNPVTTQTNLHYSESSETRTITVFDIIGQPVDKINIAPHTTFTQYSATHLRFGTYTLVLHSSTGIHVQKMIVIR